MSDSWFNIRFGKRHWQLSRGWKMRFRENSYWVFQPEEYAKVSWFQVYCAFGRHF